MGGIQAKAPFCPRDPLKMVLRVYCVMSKVFLKVVPGPTLVCNNIGPKSYISSVSARSGRICKVATVPSGTSVRIKKGTS